MSRRACCAGPCWLAACGCSTGSRPPPCRLPSIKDGVWGQPSPPLVFDIAPPYWQRWWFRLAVVLSALMLAWVGHRTRERMHARRRRELEVQVRTGTQELEQAQSQLQRYVEAGKPCRRWFDRHDRPPRRH